MNTRLAVLVGLMGAVAAGCQKQPVQSAPRIVSKAPLPATLPDSLMQRNRWALAPEHITSLFLRGIVAVHFNSDATIHERELAMRSVNGFAVARTPLGPGDGIYYLKLVVDKPDSMVFRAIRVLRQNRAVRNARPEMIEPVRPPD
jgi:hypothetical protein